MARKILFYYRVYKRIKAKKTELGRRKNDVGKGKKGKKGAKKKKAPAPVDQAATMPLPLKKTDSMNMGKAKTVVTPSSAAKVT